MEVFAGVGIRAGISGVLATWLSVGGACMYRLSVHCAAEVHLWLVAGFVADANFVIDNNPTWLKMQYCCDSRW